MIPDKNSSFETTALPELAAKRRLSANRSVTFWHPMDTPEDRASLERICATGTPWLVSPPT